MNGKRAKDHRKSAREIAHLFTLSKQPLYEDMPNTARRKPSPGLMPGIGVDIKNWPTVTTVTKRLAVCKKAAYRAIKKGKLADFLKKVR